MPIFVWRYTVYGSGSDGRHGGLGGAGVGLGVWRSGRARVGGRCARGVSTCPFHPIGWTGCARATSGNWSCAKHAPMRGAPVGRPITPDRSVGFKVAPREMSEFRRIDQGGDAFPQGGKHSLEPRVKEQGFLVAHQEMIELHVNLRDVNREPEKVGGDLMDGGHQPYASATGQICTHPLTRGGRYGSTPHAPGGRASCRPTLSRDASGFRSMMRSRTRQRLARSPQAIGYSPWRCSGLRPTPPMTLKWSKPPPSGMRWS